MKRRGSTYFAGMFKDSITLLAPQRTEDGQGGFTEYWVDGLVGFRADFRDVQPPREFTFAGQLRAHRFATFRFPDHPYLWLFTQEWRIRDVEGVEWEIVSLQQRGDSGLWFGTCKNIVPPHQGP